MNADSESHAPPGLNREEFMSMLFLNMVVQQTNMALVFLGKVPHPETGQTVREMDAARIFIDQLEMLEAKTKGNLNQREQALLRQSLTELRLAFVEAVRESPAQQQKASQPEPQQQPKQPAAESAPSSTPPPAEEEPRKRFSKKY